MDDDYQQQRISALRDRSERFENLAADLAIEAQKHKLLIAELSERLAKYEPGGIPFETSKN